jgi:hypothetical protein
MDNKVKKTNNTSFAKLIADNRFLMVLSIAIAFALWLWVAIEKSPEIEVVISGIPVNVDYEKIYDQYNQLEPFGDQTFTINVTVKGKKYIVEALDKDDIIALADTTDISGAGTSTLQVYVSQKEKNANFDIVSVSSKKIDIYLDYFSEKKFELNSKLTQDKVEEGLLLGDVAFTKNGSKIKYVTISGPKKEVDLITEVIADTDITEKLNQRTEISLNEDDIDIITRDGTNLKYTSIVSDISNLTLEIPILKVVELTPIVHFVNAPEGFAVEPKIQPSKVKAAVPVEDVDRITEIPIYTIDVKDLNVGNNKIKIYSDSVETYKIVDTLESFTVQINFPHGKYSSTQVLVPASSIIIENTNDTYDVTLGENNDIDVVIIGPVDGIENIESSEIIVSVDASSKSINKNTNVVPATIIIKNNDKCWVYGTYNVNVIVTQK